jgi:hypothetical protein
MTKKTSRRKPRSLFNPDRDEVCRDFINAKKKLNLTDDKAFLYLVVKHSGGREGVKNLSQNEILERANVIVEIVNATLDEARSFRKQEDAAAN